MLNHFIGKRNLVMEFLRILVMRYLTHFLKLKSLMKDLLKLRKILIKLKKTCKQSKDYILKSLNDNQVFLSCSLRLCQ